MRREMQADLSLGKQVSQVRQSLFHLRNLVSAQLVELSRYVFVCNCTDTVSNKKRPETRIDKLSLKDPPDLLEHKLLDPTYILQ